MEALKKAPRGEAIDFGFLRNSIASLGWSSFRVHGLGLGAQAIGKFDPWPGKHRPLTQGSPDRHIAEVSQLRYRLRDGPPRLSGRRHNLQQGNPGLVVDEQ